MSNHVYAIEHEVFIREHSELTDRQLTEAFNVTFGTNAARGTIRKKRQRMGLTKTAESVRMQWCRLMGIDEDELTKTLRDDPPKDIGEELEQLAAAKRLSGGFLDGWTVSR